MFKAIFIFSILFYSLFVTKHDDPLDIEWSRQRKLSYADFQAPVNDALGFGGASACMIKSSYKKTNDTLTYNIRAVFVEYFSFIQDKDSLLLIHEQGHFDIYEFYARVLRKKISSISNKQTNIDSIVNSINQDVEKHGDTYDIETHHGADIDQQEKWNNKIKKMLDSLCYYENPTGKFFVK